MYILNSVEALPFAWCYALIFIRIAWVTTIIRNTLLVFLLDSLFLTIKFSIRHAIYSLASCVFISAFVATIIGQIFNTTFSWTIPLMKTTTIYSHIFLLLPSICLVLYRINHNNYPRIFKKQIATTIYCLIFPYICIEVLWIYPFQLTSQYLCIFNIIVPSLIFYCTRKLVEIRFLNMNDYVQTPTRFSFIKNFTDVLESMGQASTVTEISLITKNLFHKAFSIPNTAVHVYISTSSKILPSNEYDNTAAVAISSLLGATNMQLLKTIHQAKILIYDDIDFTNYYEKCPENENLLIFLRNINTDVFIPIYNQQKIIGCITIDKEARPKSFYGHTERVEMIIYASYLGNTINLLQNRNLEEVLVREKNLKNELYNKLQETTQCKEILRSLLKSAQQKKIGVVFYKTRQFIFGNHEAQELININLNMHIGHPTAKVCKQVVADVERFKTTQTQIATDDAGKNLVICGMPYLERTHVILLIYYQEAPDIIINQLNQFQDPSSWDYLFYLQTTESGRLINSLISRNQ